MLAHNKYPSLILLRMEAELRERERERVKGGRVIFIMISSPWKICSPLDGNFCETSATAKMLNGFRFI